MATNMRYVDRLVRVLVAFVILVLFANELITGTLAIVLVGIASILLITSALGYCPLYSILRSGASRNKTGKRS
jgi:hypothetical protein